MTRGAMRMLFNPNTTPVVCDKEGHIVDGSGRRQVDKVDEVAQEAIDNGLLVLESDDGPVHEDADSADSNEQEAPPKRAPGVSTPKKST